MDRALNVHIGFFFFLSQEEVVEVLGETEEESRNSSPRIHCGWLLGEQQGEGYRERETKGRSQKSGGGRRAAI